MTDERIINAIDGIEPDINAKQRMYCSILEKAKKKSKTANTLRIAKPLASAAACICLVAVAAILLKLGSGNFDITSSGADNASAENMFTDASADFYDDAFVGAADYGIDFTTVPEFAFTENESAWAGETSDKAYSDGYAAAESPSEFYEAAEDSFEDMVEYENAETNAPGIAGISFILPEEAVLETDVMYEVSSVDFNYNGHSYTISASTNDFELSGIEGEIIGSEEIDSAANAVLYFIENGDTVSFWVNWSNGIYYYSLYSADEVEKESFIGASIDVIEYNR